MSKSKAKGTRFENFVAEAFRRAGVSAERMPMSGAAKGYEGDVVFGAEGLKAECKHHANGFKTIYKHLSQGEADILAVKADHKPALAIMPLAGFAEVKRRQELGDCLAELAGVLTDRANSTPAENAHYVGIRQGLIEAADLITNILEAKGQAVDTAKAGACPAPKPNTNLPEDSNDS